MWCRALLLLVALVGHGSASVDPIIRVPLKRTESGVVGTFGFGTPAQYLDLLVDTSGTTIWAYSQKCSYSSIACWNHNRFDGSKSKSYTTNNIDITLPDESTGFVSRDTMTVGTGELVTDLGNMSFVEVVSRSGMTVGESEYFDGVFGIGLPGAFETPHMPPPPYFKMLGSRNQRIITLYLSNEKSEMGFGGIDYSLVKTETLAFTDVVIDHCWTINIESISVGNQTLCSKNCGARLDTASEGIMGPDQLIKEVRKVSRNTESDGYFSCSRLEEMPPLNFAIGGKIFTLNAADYAIKHNYVFGLCSDGLTDLGSEETYWILGNSFIAKYFTVFDIGSKQVGFGQHKSK